MGIRGRLDQSLADEQTSDAFYQTHQDTSPPFGFTADSWVTLYHSFSVNWRITHANAAAYRHLA